jgi:hypothetical protein
MEMNGATCSQFVVQRSFIVIISELPLLILNSRLVVDFSDDQWSNTVCTSHFRFLVSIQISLVNYEHGAN